MGFSEGVSVGFSEGFSEGVRVTWRLAGGLVIVGEDVVGIGLVVGECDGAADVDGAKEILGLCDTVGETVGCGISNCNDRIRNPSNR